MGNVNSVCETIWRIKMPVKDIKTISGTIAV